MNDQKEIKRNDTFEVTKETIERLIQAGLEYSMMLSGKLHTGAAPEIWNDFVEYNIKKIVLHERDDECLKCGRYLSKSCEGVPDRHREVITEGNRCSGFYNKERANMDYSNIRTLRIHNNQFDAIEKNGKVIILLCAEDSRIITYVCKKADINCNERDDEHLTQEASIEIHQSIEMIKHLTGLSDEEILPRINRFFEMFEIDLSVEIVKIHKDQFDAIEKKGEFIILTCIEDGRVISYEKTKKDKSLSCRDNITIPIATPLYDKEGNEIHIATPEPEIFKED